MNSVKILHCADLHFDTSFSGLTSSEKQEERKEDLRETFGEIINIVKKENIQILLIAGDLFDNERVMRTTIDYLLIKFNEIQNTHIFISPGNHDPLNEKSYYNIIKWPSNVHIFTEEMGMIELTELNTCIFGIGFSNQLEKNSLLENFEYMDKDKINILLMHGDVVSKGQNSDYNPIYIENLEESGMDYIALGHTHEYSKIQKAGRTFWSYSGSPEGRGFDETGSKGIVKGEITKGSCNLEFREICKRKYFVKNLDISNTTTYEEIVHAVNVQIDDKNKENNLYKLVLKGSVSKGFTININLVKEKLKNYFYFLKLEDNTTYAIDYSSLEKEYSLKGIFVKKMRDKLKTISDEREAQIIRDAIKFGMESLEEGEVIIE
ncbi:MAG TPA: DNA repair exonuclease [Clostridiaceae bacterium]